MATGKIRRVPRTSESWIDEMRWVNIDAVDIRDASASKVRALAPILVKWGGAASILGGVLWSIVALYLGSAPPPWELAAFFSIFNALFAIDNTLTIAGIFMIASLALLVFGLLGFAAAQLRHTGRLGVAGIVIACAGLIYTMVATLDLTRWSDRGLINIFSWSPIETWYFHTVLGLLATSAGVILFALAALRHRTLPPWKTSLLMVGSVLLHSKIAVNLLANREPYDWSDLLLSDLPLTSGLVFFGLMWVIIGVDQLRMHFPRGTKNTPIGYPHYSSKG